MSRDSITVVPAGDRKAVATIAAAIALAGTGRQARGAKRSACSARRSSGRDSARSPAMTDGRTMHRLGHAIARTAHTLRVPLAPGTRVEDGEATLSTRKGLDWTTKFSAIAKAAVGLPDCLIEKFTFTLNGRTIQTSIMLTAIEALRSGAIVQTLNTRYLLGHAGQRH